MHGNVSTGRAWDSILREGRPFTGSRGKLAALWNQRDQETVCEAPGAGPGFAPTSGQASVSGAWGGGLIGKSWLRALLQATLAQQAGAWLLFKASGEQRL